MPPPIAFFARFCFWLVTIGAVPALALAGLGVSGARAAEVDCSSITMRFDGAGYAVDCEAETETYRTNSANGGGQSEFLNATANDESHFLLAIDIRATGDIYYTHQSLYNRIKDYFADIGVADWHHGADFADFEIGEFNGAVRAHPSRCLAFQRTVNPVRNGYRRVVFGIGCSLRNLGQVYDALKQLDAPGD
jgi:hypothetical protein